MPRSLVPGTTVLLAAALALPALAHFRPRFRAPNSLERQALDLLNATRANPRYRGETHGQAAPLHWSAEASAAALSHSEEMARRHALSHSDPEGANPGVRLTDAGVSWTGVGENVGMASSLATVHRLMMDEPAHEMNHRGNILNPAFTEVGIGIYRAPDGLLWVTEDFVTPTSARR